jgi:lysophospholipase L1-like esterase
MTAHASRRRLAFAAVAIVLGSLLGFLVGEVGLRLFRPQVFPVHPPGLYVLDPAVGYRLAPGFEGVLERSEYRHEIRIDDRGVRTGAERDPSPDALRVLVLGDSQAFGFGVANHETFPAVLENLLRADGAGRDAVVVNAGVPGYGTADELAFLEAHGAAFDPDVVVLQFLSTNDPTDNRNPAATWAGLRDGMLVSNRPEDPGQRPSLLARAKRASHLVNLASNTAGYLAVRAGLLEEDDRVGGGAVTDADLERTRDLLEAVVRRSRALGAPCLLLHTTGQAGILSETYVQARAATAVREAARRAGAIWIDGARALHGREDRASLHYPRDGHWTPAGHRAIAELLAETVAALADGRLYPPRGVPGPDDWIDAGVTVLPGGEDGSWKRWLLGGFALATVDLDGERHVYFQGSSGMRSSDWSVTGRAIGVATLDADGAFREHPGNPVLTFATRPGASGEEGAVAIAVVPERDGVLALYGANAEETATLVNADIRIARSPDGIAFRDEGVLLRHDDPAVWGSGDELFPVAAFRSGGAVHVYYVPNGVAERRRLGVARDAFGADGPSTGPVLAPEGA